MPFSLSSLIMLQRLLPFHSSVLDTYFTLEVIPMNLRQIFTNLRLVIWPLCMAYVAFLLPTTKSAASLSVMIIAGFLGAMIGFALGIMFANRAHRKAQPKRSGVIRH